MSGQLFSPGPPAEASLTTRQRTVLAAVRTTEGGSSAKAVGADLHRTTYLAGGRRCLCCTFGQAPCMYAEGTGTEVLTRLRELGYGLVRRQATGLWEIPGVTPKPGHLGPGSLPEGF